MNKKQRMVIGIALILIGVLSFILMGLIVEDNQGHYFYKIMYEFYFIGLIGIVFTGGGIFVLISKEGDLKKEIKK